MDTKYLAPSPDDLKSMICGIIDRVMDGGRAKHGEHIWFLKETVRHHADRASRHALTASMRWEGDESSVSDGETAIDHMERSIVRGLFALAKMRNIPYGH